MAIGEIEEVQGYGGRFEAALQRVLAGMEFGRNQRRLVAYNMRLLANGVRLEERQVILRQSDDAMQSLERATGLLLEDEEVVETANLVAQSRTDVIFVLNALALLLKNDVGDNPVV
ncbi:MAG: hypothetical protein JWR04_806 [Rhodoglobus sp.]|nr:hypothetical protein [Rhodoglobus sp.]